MQAIAALGGRGVPVKREGQGNSGSFTVNGQKPLVFMVRVNLSEIESRYMTTMLCDMFFIVNMITVYMRKIVMFIGVGKRHIFRLIASW